MPRIALLSDIHSNIHALRSVLHNIESLDIDRIVCCGDVVGYGPHPAECVQLLRDMEIPSVMGNHDFYVDTSRLEPMVLVGETKGSHEVWGGIRYSLDSLDAAALDWIRELPATLEIPGAIVAHAALHNFDEWRYLQYAGDAKPTLEVLQRVGFNVGFFGHTHLQNWFSQSVGQIRKIADDTFHISETGANAVTVGSVGQPRDGDPRASWAIWDSDAHTIEFRRTEYPVELTIQAIIDAGLPVKSGTRLRTGT